MKPDVTGLLRFLHKSAVAFAFVVCGSVFCIRGFAEDPLITQLSANDVPRIFLRETIIERRYDAEIVKANSEMLLLLDEHKIKNPSLRIHVASLLLDGSELTTRQVLQLCTVLYIDVAPYETEHIPSILIKLLTCLPDGGDDKDIYGEITKAGWTWPPTGQPLPFDYFQRYKKYVDDKRGKSRGRGPVCVPFAFPFATCYSDQYGSMQQWGGQ